MEAGEGEDAIRRPGVLSVFCEMGLGKEGIDGESEKVRAWDKTPTVNEGLRNQL